MPTNSESSNHKQKVTTVFYNVAKWDYNVKGRKSAKCGSDDLVM